MFESKKWAGRGSILTAMTAAGALAFTGVAFADDVDMGNNSMTVPEDGTGTFTVQLLADNDGVSVDPVVGCNATTAKPVTITFTAEDAWATVDKTSVEVTDCTTQHQITVSVDGSGVTTTTAAKTKLTGTATGGRSATVTEVVKVKGKDEVSETIVQPGYTADFINVHVPMLATTPVVTAPDADGDGVPDSSDNCVNLANADQADADNDGKGNPCDLNSYAPAAGSVSSSGASGTEGDTLAASGAFTDADGNDSLTLTANNNVGNFTDNKNGTWSWSLGTNDDVASGTITVTASDGEHDNATQQFSYVALNANPVITEVVQSRQGPCAVTLDPRFTDAGSGDTHTESVLWDNGSTDMSRTFTAAGTYSATVTVTDDDGGTDSEIVSGVRAYNTPSTILAPINTTGTRSTFKIGSTIPVKITVTGCDGSPVSNLSPAVNLVQGDTIADGSVNEPLITEVATNGKLMRWSDTQYIYNLSTKNSQFNGGAALTGGTYTVSVMDPSFSAPVKAVFDLRK